MKGAEAINFVLTATTAYEVLQASSMGEDLEKLFAILGLNSPRLTHSLRTIGEAGVQELLKATIDTALDSKAIKPAELERLSIHEPVERPREPGSIVRVRGLMLHGVRFSE